MAQSTRTRLTTLSAHFPDDIGFTLVVALLSLLPRLYVAIAWTKEPVWDGHYYHFGATRIAEGLGYSEDVLIGGAAVWKPWCHYPVGYSAFLGGLYKLFGSTLWVAPVANAVVGALTVAVVHRVATHWLERPRARVAAALCAIHPGLILYTGLVMTEALSAFSLVLVGMLALTFRDRKLGGVLAGLVLGLGALVRPTALLAGPLLLRVFAGGYKRVLVNTALAALVSTCVILPWTWRNCRVMDGCALISTNGGWNLAIGALTDTGRFETLTANDGCPVVTGQVQQDRCWADVGMEAIRRDPMAWLGLIPKKLAHTYNHESFAIGYMAVANPDLWTDARRETVRATMTVFHHALMAAAALAGVALLRPRIGARRRTGIWRWKRIAEGARSVSLSGLGKVFAGLRRVSVGDLVQPLLLAGWVFWILFSIQHPEHPFFWLIVASPLLLWIPLPRAPIAGPAAFYLSGLVLATSVTHAVFFGDDRYHMTISPVLCILAAAALRPPAPNPNSTEPNPA